MDARQLEYIVAVDEEGSFTKAAARHHIAQSALSHQVARLEAELGFRIFDRTSRSVRLSDAGQVLLPYARQILQDIANARAALAELAGVMRGSLRLAMTQTAGRTLDLVALIGTFHRRFPDIELTTMTGPGRELIENVRNGGLDIALAALSAEGIPADLTFDPVGDPEPLVAVVPADHQLAARKRVRLEELAKEGSFVEFRPGTALREQVDAAFVAAGVRRTSSFEVGQIADMIQYAANGLGATIVPRAFTGQRSDGLYPARPFRVLELAGSPLSLTIGVFKKAGRDSPSTEAFLAMLLAANPRRPLANFAEDVPSPGGTFRRARGRD
jgi:DNA-binding transcriptional LysR family regulator